MNDAAHFLFVIGTLSTVLIAVLIIRAMLPKLFNWFSKTAFPIPKVVLSTITVALLAVFVVSKDFLPNSFNSPLQSPYVTLYSTSSAATLNALTNAISPAQYRAGFALTAVTNITHDFTAPTNAVFCDLGPGVHDEAFWIPLAFNPEGTATNSRWGRAVCAAPSGMVLLNDVPDRLAPSLPDLSGAVTNRILSVLQTPAGLLPPAGALWYANGGGTAATNGSFLITWQKVFLGRQTNAVADLQIELFESGDFIYRLRLDENADASTVTNWLIAAQDNGGGEVFSFAEDIPLPQLESDPFSFVATTNLIPAGISLSPQTLELHWTSFGELDPDLSDNDGDNLSDWDELFVHHTDPGNPDTDGDGLSDDEELSSGFSPLNPDRDNDGIADGIDAQPLVWNNADDDTDGDGLGLAYERLHGLDPATNDGIDSDGDSWADWKEILAGTNPNGSYSTPLNDDGSCKIFDVTFTLNPPLNGSVAVKVGDRGMVLTPASPTCTLTLREGVAHDVSLFTANPCTVSLSALIASPYASFQNPHAVFSGTAFLLGKWAVASGMIAQPVPDIEPELICFHDRDSKHVEAIVSPEMPGSYLWWSDGVAIGSTGKSIELLYAGNDTVVEIAFTAGATSARIFNREVFRCVLLEEHPEWLDDDFDTNPPHPAEEPAGESDTGGPEFDAYDGSGLLVPVNNDDDDANVSDDFDDQDLAIVDNDLVGYYPLGYFTGECCPCPEHQVQYAESATLLSSSSHLALYSDACKSNDFTGAIDAGEILYVEGRSKSASVGAEEIVWQYTGGGQTHQLTNVFTVLSQRIFGDLDFDDDIDTADKALNSSLSTTNGWVMPVATNVFRMTQLRTDVDVPGVHTLSLSGDAFRVWQSANPGPTNAPLLVGGQTVTNGVNGVSWGMNHTTNVYIQAVTNGTATLTYSYIGTGSASGIVCRATMKLTAVNFALVPDYDRDRVIDWQDQAGASTNRILRWWINDDDDNGTDVAEGANDVPGQGYGATTVSNDTQWPDSETVDGRCDLLDFFPLWLDLGDLLSAFPTNGSYTLRLSQTDNALWAVYTDFANTNAGAYLVSAITNCGPDFAQATHEAETFLVDASGVDLEQAFVNKIIADPLKGILLMEGCAETQNPLVLEVFRNGIRIALVEMPLHISGVEDMYRFHNLRFDPELPEGIDEPSNLPDAECGNVDVFLAHGFLVGEDESRAWGAEFFKRLWQEGSRARFHAVTWSSDSLPDYTYGPNMSYEYNVNNAFLSASNYAARVNAVKATNQSEVVVMAHSLGNMLTSAAINDWGMQADKYFALNGAVPAEAFDMSMVDVRTNALNRLLHPEWRNYRANTWSANYHQLFTNSAAFPNDARTNLTWRGRFANAAPILYNFWSSGDEVLEISETEVDLTSGIEWDWEWTWPPVSANTRRYVWHKQALFKGRDAVYGTSWSGWGFWEWLLGGKVYTLAEANALTEDELRAAPVFRHNPEEMFSSNIVKSVQNNVLARGIPELSYPIGYTNVTILAANPTNNRNVDMNTTLRRSDNAWPQRDVDFSTQSRPRRWLHTDLMNVSHYHTHKLFEAIVTKGNMK